MGVDLGRGVGLGDRAIGYSPRGASPVVECPADPDLILQVCPARLSHAFGESRESVGLVLFVDLDGPARLGSDQACDPVENLDRSGRDGVPGSGVESFSPGGHSLSIVAPCLFSSKMLLYRDDPERASSDACPA